MTSEPKLAEEAVEAEAVTLPEQAIDEAGQENKVPEAANDDESSGPAVSEEDAALEASDQEGDLEDVGEVSDEVIDYELDQAHVRMAEALLFAAAEPLDEKTLADRMPDGIHFPTVLQALSEQYEGRGVQLVQVARRWQFRTAEDLGFLMEKERVEQRRLSRAAVETLAIISYHQPVTRAEIEEVRGVSVSKGTIDVLMEVGWVKLRGRKRVPGRPVTYGTTDDFLEHFGLENVKDLPGMEELKSAGLLDARLPPGFSVPQPGEQTAEEEASLSEEDEELAESYRPAVDDEETGQEELDL